VNDGFAVCLCPADGCLRFFLRGRVINMYAPTALMSNYPPQPSALPRQKLALEWVYPFITLQQVHEIPTFAMSVCQSVCHAAARAVYVEYHVCGVIWYSLCQSTLARVAVVT